MENRKGMRIIRFIQNTMHYRNVHFSIGTIRFRTTVLAFYCKDLFAIFTSIQNGDRIHP